jgi:hypothetical protein
MNRVRRPLLVAVGAPLTALLLALLVRHLAIESHAIGQACDVAGAPAWCWPRQAVVLAFTYSLFGVASLAAGVLCHVRGGAKTAAAAMAFGAAGLVLYNPEPSAIGFLLGLIGLPKALRGPAEGP